MKRLCLALLVLFTLLVVSPLRAKAANMLRANTDEAMLDFPNTITFRAQLTANTSIQSVVLEYGDNQLTCGEVIAKAFPEFTPGKTINVQWTWDMRQSGSIPPGATIWWRWRITDANGQESVTEKKTITCSIRPTSGKPSRRAIYAFIGTKETRPLRAKFWPLPDKG